MMEPFRAESPLLDPAKPLELSGQSGCEPTPCVVCGSLTDTAFRAPGQPGQPMLPLHAMCGMRLIVAARDFLEGRPNAWAAKLFTTDGWPNGQGGRPLSDSAQAGAGSSPAPSANTAGVINLWSEFEFETTDDAPVIGDLTIRWKCEHGKGRIYGNPLLLKAGDASLLTYLGARLCAACDWTVERCAPATTAEA